MCTAGKYSDETGLTLEGQCTECGAGFYSTSGVGQISIDVCKACGPGRYATAGAGQISINVCVNCSAARYSDEEAQITVESW